ncbi:MAG: hypothetical protein Q4B40_01090 [Clostridia bacterium]|nr:hypothetical protein [Clostridia bacterium]
MKKVISVFLSIAFIICSLPVTALAAVGLTENIYLNTPIEVTIENSGDYSEFLFTPTETAHYLFYSLGEYDTFGEILNPNGEILNENDDSGDLNFTVGYVLNAGETYVMKSRMLGNDIGSFTVVIIKSNVESVKFDDITVTEGLDSSIAYDYNPDTDSNDIEWVRYYYTHKISGTVTFNDGSTQAFTDGCFEIDGRKNYAFSNDTQSYNNSWQSGETYTVTASIYGFSGSFNITVEPNPIKKLEVSDIEIIEGTNQSFDYDYANPDQPIEYLSYEYYPDFTVTFQDGTTKTITDTNYIEIDGTQLWLEVYDDQSSTNLWGIGSHTVTASLCGVETTFNVEITQSPIKKIEISDIEIIEGTNQILDWDYSNPDQTVEYLKYSYYPDFTVTFQDGTTQTVTDRSYIEIDGTQLWLEVFDDQSSTNLWGVGPHKVTASLLGVETTFNVEITETPIESISVENVSIIEGTNGYFYREDNNQYYKYDYYPEITVNFKDGTTQTTQYGFYLDDTWVNVYYDDTQDFYTPWGVGKHTVTATLCGISDTFTVEITETPIRTLTINDTTVDYNLNSLERYEWGEPYNGISYDPTYTVTLKNGKVIKSQKDNCGNQYINIDGNIYTIEYTDTQAENNWDIGRYTAIGTLMNVSDSFNVEVVSDYTDITISGSTDLKVKLTKNNGEIVTLTAKSFAGYGYDGIGDGWLYFDNLKCAVKLNCNIDNEGENDYTSGLVLQIGTLTSNELNGNVWLKNCFKTINYNDAAIFTHHVIKDTYGRVFNSYIGVINDQNITEIITMAANICDDIYDYEYVLINGNDNAVMDVDVVKQNIQEVFGISNVDITKAEGYDPANPDKIYVLIQNSGGGEAINNFYYSNDNWIFEHEPDDYHKQDYDSIKIVLDNNLYIKSIDFISKQPIKTGWQMSDGKLWYAFADGTGATDWEKIDDIWYYFDDAGWMQTGWLKLNNKWYYLNTNGAMATDWSKISGRWYYFNTSGVMLTKWQKLGGTWYYLGADGAMATGWKQIGKTWYYFNTSGAMQTGWQKISGTWYYFNSSGAMQTGWQKIGGTWYFFNASGAMKTGWLKLGSTWYYFTGSGAMVTGNHNIGGKVYRFNSSGACLNP